VRLRVKGVGVKEVRDIGWGVWFGGFRGVRGSLYTKSMQYSIYAYIYMYG
jgi:hypothetical protein